MTIQWFSEYSTYSSPKEKKELIKYLKLWKKFFLKSLPLNMKPVDEKWIEKEYGIESFVISEPTIALRIGIEDKRSLNESNV